MRYKIEKIGHSYEVQRYGLQILDGCEDIGWRTVHTCWDENEANRILKSYQTPSLEAVRRSAARDIANEYGVDPGHLLIWMQNAGVLESRSEVELRTAPIDTEEIASCYLEYLDAYR